SVSSSNSTSSAATASPSCFNQRTMTPSVTDSPRAGICTSTAMTLPERARDDLRLLALMTLVRSDGRARRFVAAAIAQRPTAEQRRQSRLHEMPGAHVPRLFLCPEHFFGAAERRQGRADGFGREWIELLDAHQRDVGQLALLPCQCQVVVDLAAAQYDASHP